MKNSTKDKAKGSFHKVKGKVKEFAGKLSNNSKMKAEGTREKIAGQMQGKVGGVKKILGQ